MRPSSTKLHREELYTRVWQIPVSRLAKEYGLTDYRFRKICKTLHVPTPPAGYWAKLRHGHNVKPAPLPALPKGASEIHVVHHGLAHLEIMHGSPAAANSKVTEHRFDVPEIPVPAQLRSPHPLVARTRKTLKEDHPDRYGRVGSRAGKATATCVAPKSIGRALRILNALVKAAEQLGHTVAIGSGRHSQWHLQIEEEKVSFRLLEKVRRVELKPEERTFSWNRWDYVPTGLLRLELTDAYWHVGRKQWSDGKKLKLEDQLDSFLIGAYEAALSQKGRRLKREEEARRKKEEERRRLEAERQREAERARRRALEEAASRWQQAQALRAYIAEVERRTEKGNLNKEDQKACDAWLRWAREHAGRLDPLSGGLPFGGNP